MIGPVGRFLTRTYARVPATVWSWRIFLALRNVILPDAGGARLPARTAGYAGNTKGASVREQGFVALPLLLGEAPESCRLW